MGREFARKYPKVAGGFCSIRIAATTRMWAGSWRASRFLPRACIAGSMTTFPRSCESLTRIIHPGYLRPIPSMTIVEFQPDPAQGKKTAGMRIPRGTPLVTKATVDGIPCRFHTAYDVDLWPFSIAAAEWRQPERMQRPPRVFWEFTAAAAAAAAAALPEGCGVLGTSALQLALSSGRRCERGVFALRASFREVHRDSASRSEG